MNFVFPQFLWALTALSLPVLVHLFNFRRTKRVFFSNNRFLEEIKKKVGYRNKLKRYLILLARMLFLFFLVTAFAKPFIPAREQTINTQNVIFYLDNSFSMSVSTPSNTRAIDSGIDFIRNIVKSFPPTAQYRLITNDFAPFSNSPKSADQLLDLLTQIRLSATSRTAEEIVSKMGADAQNVDVFWISDFQKSTFGESEKLTVDNDIRWHPVPIDMTQHSNVYVDSVYLDNPFPMGGNKNSIKIKITNASPQRVNNLTVKLIINDIQSGVASVSVKSGHSEEVSFDLATDLSGLNTAKVHIDDPLASFDNDFYFTLSFTATIRVVEIKEDRTNEYVKNVFGNPKIFTHSDFLPGNIDYSELVKADLVVLNGLSTIDNSLITLLQAAMGKNTSALLFIPEEKPDLVAYGKLLGKNDLTAEINGKMIPLDEPDMQNPFFKDVFEEQSTALKMPLAAPVIRWGKHYTALLRLRDTRPFLLQKDNLFLLASPLKMEYTDFGNHAIFVPVMYKIATSIKRTGQRMYYTLTDNLIAIRTDSAVGEPPIKLVGDREIVPQQHRVREKIFLEIPKFSMPPGFYCVKHRQDTLDLLAINLDKRESDLLPFKEEEIASLYGDSRIAPIFQAANAKIFLNDIKEGYLGTPLWKVALLLALLFLLVEVLLIRYLK